MTAGPWYPLFLSTLSLRRATPRYLNRAFAQSISIHALLAESDGNVHYMGVYEQISIHALLAESDVAVVGPIPDVTYFYPRSPCGERRSGRLSLIGIRTFLSTLSLRRATKHFTGAKSHDPDFYPRSPCGERQHTRGKKRKTNKFLSTLSLRRATGHHIGNRGATAISIHALLAESDGFRSIF